MSLCCSPFVPETLSPLLYLVFDKTGEDAEVLFRSVALITFAGSIFNSDELFKEIR